MCKHPWFSAPSDLIRNDVIDWRIYVFLQPQESSAEHLFGKIWELRWQQLVALQQCNMGAVMQGPGMWESSGSLFWPNGQKTFWACSA